MKPPNSRCKCLHCKRFFIPDSRNRGRQKYCHDPACRRASKQASQRRWLAQPGNQDYFRGPDNVQRVQAWRATHPGYWKRERKRPQTPLQETCKEQPADKQPVEQELPAQVSPPALQDLCAVKTPLLVGLIAQFTDAALQEDIAVYVGRLVARGQDILDQPSRRFLKGNNTYDAKENPAPGTTAVGADAI